MLFVNKFYCSRESTDGGRRRSLVMPMCMGLPDGPCPQKRNDNSVRIGEGDLMLCKSCNDERFSKFLASRPQSSSQSGETTKSSVRTFVKSGKVKNTVANMKTHKVKTSASSDDSKETFCCQCQLPCKTKGIQCDICLLCYDQECSNFTPDVFETLLKIVSQVGWACSNCRNTCRTKFSEMQAKQAVLAEHMSDTLVSLACLQDEINELKVGTTSLPALRVSNSGTNQTDASSVPEYVPVPAVIKSTVVTTLYDLQRRKSNIIITGLPESDDDVDAENDDAAGDATHDERLFAKLCEEHLPIKPQPVHNRSRRLGSINYDGRPRRLLIRLKSEHDVKSILSAAKRLRESDDDYVRKYIYINPDLSPAEAKLAYEKREKRRKDKRHEASKQASRATCTSESVTEAINSACNTISTASTFVSSLNIITQQPVQSTPSVTTYNVDSEVRIRVPNIQYLDNNPVELTVTTDSGSAAPASSEAALPTYADYSESTTHCQTVPNSSMLTKDDINFKNNLLFQ